jgi:hypothetical protein
MEEIQVSSSSMDVLNLLAMLIALWHPHSGVDVVCGVQIAQVL